MTIHVLCFSPYPDEGPSVYHRIVANTSYWAKDADVDLKTHGFMNTRLYKIRRQFGFLKSAEKILLTLWCTFLLILKIPLSSKQNIIIIHREAFPFGGIFFEKMIHRFNSNMIYDVDDNIWTPPSNDIHQRALWSDPNRYGKMMSLCRTVIVGNSYLKESYASQYSKQVVVIPTPYSLPEKLTDKKKLNPIRLVWLGNLGNAEYLNIILKNLEELALKYDIILRLIGGVDIYNIKSSEIKIEYFLWSREHEASWLQECSIGINPLYNKPYEQGKCSFKIIQYFSVGLPAVASPVGMNKDVIEHGVNGYLATSFESWTHGLECLIKDSDLCQKFGDEGKIKYKKLYSRTATSKQWKAIFENSLHRDPKITQA